jgi:uncharacterized YigZ family protein
VTPGSPDRYRTLTAPVRVETEVRRSRFACDLRPVSSEAAARGVLDEVRAESRDAGHHCSAWVLGPDASTVRSHDDGEPSGTAGAPMLDVLRGRALIDVVAVVSRWFGGTLLGTGGLIRAYGDAVAAAVDAAALVTMRRRDGLVVDVPAADGARVENALRGRSDTTVDESRWHATGLVLHLAVEPASTGAVEGVVASLTSGLGRVSPGHPQWVATRDPG